MEKLELVQNWLRNQADDDHVVDLWNEYSSEQNYDDTIYRDLDELAELLGDDPVEFARKVYFGNVSDWQDPYFKLNAYGNIDSFCYLTEENSPIDFENLAEWLIDSEHEAIAELLEDEGEV